MFISNTLFGAFVDHCVDIACISQRFVFVRRCIDRSCCRLGWCFFLVRCRVDCIYSLKTLVGRIYSFNYLKNINNLRCSLFDDNNVFVVVVCGGVYCDGVGVVLMIMIMMMIWNTHFRPSLCPGLACQGGKIIWSYIFWYYLTRMNILIKRNISRKSILS